MHVIPALGARTGGPAVSIIGSSLALARLPEAIETAVITTDLPATASSRARGRISPAQLPQGAESVDVRLHRVRFPRRFAYSPGLSRAVEAEISCFDVVHIHSLWLFPQYAAFAAAKKHRVPIVVSPRGALDPWLRARGRARKALSSSLWQDALLTHASVIHVTTQLEGELIADVTPASRHVVVPNGIDWHELGSLPDPMAFRAKRLNGHDGRVVLALGRLSVKKGLDVLIEAFSRIAPTHRDVVLVVAGPDDERLTPKLRKLAVERGVADRILFPGMIRGKEKLAALACADVWASPSHTENFSVAAAEALAAGRPTLLSSAINIAPDAADYAATVMVDPEIEPVASGLARLLSDEAASAEIGVRARRFARRYDWTEVAPQLAQMYRLAAARSCP